MHAFIVVVLLLVDSCSKHVYSEYFQKSSESIAAKTRKTARLLRTRERERESPMCGRNSRAKAGKINEAETDIGLGALLRLPMHKFV